MSANTDRIISSLLSGAGGAGLGALTLGALTSNEGDPAEVARNKKKNRILGAALGGTLGLSAFPIHALLNSPSAGNYPLNTLNQKAYGLVRGLLQHPYGLATTVGVGSLGLSKFRDNRIHNFITKDILPKTVLFPTGGADLGNLLNRLRVSAGGRGLQNSGSFMELLHGARNANNKIEKILGPLGKEVPFTEKVRAMFQLSNMKSRWDQLKSGVSGTPATTSAGAFATRLAALTGKGNRQSVSKLISQSELPWAIRKPNGIRASSSALATLGGAAGLNWLLRHFDK